MIHLSLPIRAIFHECNRYPKAMQPYTGVKNPEKAQCFTSYRLMACQRELPVFLINSKITRL
jgi:hypothetical protein